MLHNTGPFGPNEVPINVSGQSNMTDLSGQMNLGNSINNLSKITPQSSHPVNSHFNIPDYSNYGLNMNATINNFHSFHQAGYQPNLMHQNAANSWQNSVLPMNLNAQSDQHSMLGYYDKKFESQSDLSEQSFNKNMLNIPQVYTKALHKHLGMDIQHDYPHYNLNVNNFNSYLDHNLDLCTRSQKAEAESQNIDRLNLVHKSRLPLYPEQVDLSNCKDFERQNIDLGRNMHHHKTNRLPDYPQQVDLSNRSKHLDFQNMDARSMHYHKSQLPSYSHQTDFNSHQKTMENLIRTNFQQKPQLPNYIEQMDLSSRSSIENKSLEVSSLEIQKTNRSPYYPKQFDLSSRSKDVPQAMDTSTTQPKDDYPDQIDLSTNSKVSVIESYTQKNIVNIPKETVSVQEKPHSNPEQIEEQPKMDYPISPTKSPYSSVKLDPPKKPETEQEPIKDSLENKPTLREYLNNPELRRQNLANTVRMIENILIQTTNSKKKLEQDQADDDNDLDEEKIENIKTHTESTNDKAIDDNQSKDIDDFSQSPQSIDNLSDDQSISSTGINEDEEMRSQNSEKKTHEVYLTEIKQEYPSDSEMEVVDIKKEKSDEVVVKVEISPEILDMEHELGTEMLDMEYINPFQRDCFGVQTEDVCNSVVHDSENSITIAIDAIKNGIQINDAFLECPHCSLYFSHSKRYLIHTKWHSFGLTNEKRLELQKAKELTKNLKREARVLERMQKSEITEVEGVDGKTYNCNQCDKVFSKKASLHNHKTRFHPTRPRDCKICGKILIGWVALRDHHLTHFSEAGFYQCSDCPKKFKYSHSLAKHRDTHLEKTHECQQCPKKFGSAALLNIHMKSHERVLRGATFRCTYCAKGFFESYHLQAHERTHRNERPFPCEICKTSFGTKSGLQRHLKVSHSSSKPYECSICHRSFISEAIRDRHELRNHGNPEDFKFVCKQCPCRYLKLKDLRKHVYKVHPKGKQKKKTDSDSE